VAFFAARAAKLGKKLMPVTYSPPKETVHGN
jgi:hypothetical protein